MTALSFTKWRH